MYVLGTIVALIVGFITWGIVLAMFSGNPIGRTGGGDILLFLAPILGVTIPAVARAGNEGKCALAVWLLAIAPFFGGLNMALAAGIAWVTHSSIDGWSLPVIAMIVIWFVPALCSLFKKDKKINSSKAQCAPFRVFPPHEPRPEAD
jgi:hypothetical protein